MQMLLILLYGIEDWTFSCVPELWFAAFYILIMHPVKNFSVRPMTHMI